MSTDNENKEVIENVKPWYESKMIWFNVVSVPAVIWILQTIQKAFEQGDVPSTWLMYSPIVLAGINIILRVLTSSSVSFTSVASNSKNKIVSMLLGTLLFFQ